MTQRKTRTLATVVIDLACARQLDPTVAAELGAHVLASLDHKKLTDLLNSPFAVSVSVEASADVEEV